MARGTPYNRSYTRIRAQILDAAHHFEVLGVHKDSSNADIDKARRELAKYVHPDVNGSTDAHDLMARVNVAHEVLTGNRTYYIATLGLHTCTTCKGKGYTAKQKGFTAVVKTVCVVCKGAGGVA